MATHYDHDGKGNWVRSFYDPSIRLWTVYAVTAPNDEADQIGDAHYCIKSDLQSEIDYVHNVRNSL